MIHQPVRLIIKMYLKLDDARHPGRQSQMNEHQRQYIKLLVNTMYDIQKVRVATDNRIDAFIRAGGVSEENMADELKDELSDLVNAMEKVIERRIAFAVKAAPVMKWLKLVKGIGPRYSGTIIGIIGQPPETVSQLWSFCGMDVIPWCTDCEKIAYRDREKARFLNRQVERRYEQHIKSEYFTALKKWENSTKDDKGKEPTLENITQLMIEQGSEEDWKRESYLENEKKLCQCEQPEIKIVAPKRSYFKGLLLTHNPFLKATCWKIVGQFVRQGKFYRTYYDQQKEYYLKRDSGTISLGHIENRARRATSKLFLSHLWEMWRKSLGMPAGQIYLQHKLGADFDKYHTYIDPPHVDLFENVEIAAD